MRVVANELDDEPALSQAEAARLRSIVHAFENTHLPLKKLSLAWAYLALTLLFVAVRGSEKTDSIAGLSRCHWAVWLLFVGVVFAGLLTAYLEVRIIKSESQVKSLLGAPVAKGDIVGRKDMVQMCLISFVGGSFSGLFGIGGGIIYNPMILQRGAHPIVASATGMYLVMYSTTSR